MYGTKIQVIFWGLLGLAAAPSPALAWAEHDLVTDRALENPGVSYAQEQVQVEPLDTFLAAAPAEVAKTFEGYYAWLASTGSDQFKAQTFDASNPTTASFLTAARLNPVTWYPLVRGVLPGQQPVWPVVPIAQVSPYMRDRAPFSVVYEDATGQVMTAREVLTTFADEPDWQMDHVLWGHAEYGYGEQPYGKPEGESSKAPFHMQFLHEGFFVKSFASFLLRGMTEDRVELMLRLSRTAFETGHPYWGYRFAAWGCHYVQDLAQPYHARAVPGKKGPYYIHFALSPNKERIQTETTQLLANKHFLYEDYVAYGLVQSYTAPNASATLLSSFLSSGDLVFSDVDSGTALVEQVTRLSSAHAARIDRTIKKAFPRDMTRDPAYDVETAPDYNIPTAMGRVPERRGEQLLSQTGMDFESTGTATRTFIALARRAP